MEIKSRDLSKEDFFLLFQDLRPVPINYFHLFLAITAALLLSSALQFLAANTYAKHQLALLQKEVAMQSRVVTQSSPTHYALDEPQMLPFKHSFNSFNSAKDKLSAHKNCFDLKRQYSADQTPVNHAAMAQACTNAGMPY